MTEIPRCGQCRHWAPLIRDHNFLGRCIAPMRPYERTTDKHDTCDRFEAPVNDNLVVAKMERFLE